MRIPEDSRSHRTSQRSGPTEQVHLRLPSAYAGLLRRLATERNQTLSGAICYLLRGIWTKQRERANGVSGTGSESRPTE
jgi:hypothetical protein